MEKQMADLRGRLEDLHKDESYQAMLPLLKELAGLKMTRDLLQKSKLGVLVNKLRKQETNKEVAKLATSILLEWKKLLVDEKKPASPIPSTVRSHTPPNSGIVDLSSHELFLQFKTDDPVRDKCVEMLVTALCTDTPELMTNPDELILGTAVAVERALFSEFGSTSPAYKTKFRSKYLNLKDRSNPILRSTLLQSVITAEHFIAMSAAEMASEERRASDLALQADNLKNTQAAQDTSAETDQFKCGRCKQRKCKYYQLQTRSADEPMTTFVTCINCNNRWKFC